MATRQINRVVEQIRKVVLASDAAEVSDGQLLECFIGRREEAAFESLLRRHGPMVLSVCQRVLGNHHDAEDAFQATFLVLARKASSIMPRQMVGNWLYGVAYHTALKARSVSAKRHVREKQMNPLPEREASAQDSWTDLQWVLDQELSRLSDKYRVPIILCDLEGKSQKEAAQHLGLPEGTFSSRLSRGRAMLAKRLARQGLTFSAGALAAVLAQNGASACVPAVLASATLQAAGAFAAGRSAADLVSGSVASLTEGVLRAMVLNKLKTLTVLVILGLFTFGGGLLTQYLLAGQPAESLRDAPDQRLPDAKNTVEKQQGKGGQDKRPPNKDLEQLAGTWQLVGGEFMGQKHAQTDIEESIRRKIEWLAGLEKRKPEAIEGELGFYFVFDQKGHWKKNAGENSNFTYLDCAGDSAIDPDKKPKTIDLTVQTVATGHEEARQLDPGATKKGDVIQAIYEFVDKDTCRLCFDAPNKARPADFLTKPDSTQGIWVLKRITKELPKGIDAATVAAFKKLGATYGTLEVDQGHLWFYPTEYRAAEGCLPGFRFRGKFQQAKLPEVSVPFGLEFHSGDMTDAGMKTLKDLKNLAALSIRYANYRPGHRSQVTDRGLKELAGLKKLTFLDIYGANVTDDGLRELAGLDKITVLGLGGTRVTGAGLTELNGLKNLSRLHLGAAQVTDEGLKGLAGLNNLAILELDATEITDLKELAALKKLAELSVGHTKVTDAGLKGLVGLNRLATLGLDYTKVTDIGLKELARVKKLTVLDLDGTAVTDAGLKDLAEVKTLAELSLRETQVTDAGVALLRKALPKCNIHRD